MPLRPKSNKQKLISKFRRLFYEIKNSHKLLLVFLVAFGALLRLEPALHDTVHFSYDQGVDVSFVRNLVENHKFTLISRFTGLQGLFMGPLWTWLLVPSYLVGGGNPVANQVWMCILGTFSIIYTYLIVRYILSGTEALISSFFVALSGPFVSAAHIVLSPAPLTILMIVYIWFLWEVIGNSHDRYLPWLGLLVGIFFQFEIGFAAFLLPATIVVLFIQRKFSSFQIKQLLYGIGLFLLTFVPQFLFELRHNFIMTKSLTQFFLGKNQSLGTQGAGLYTRFGIRLGSLWEDIQSATSFLEGNQFVTLLVIIPSIVGLSLAVKNNYMKKKMVTMLTILTALIYLGFSLYSGPVWVWYRAGMPMVFILLLSIGWAELIQRRSIFLILACFTFLITAIIGIKPNELILHFQGINEGGVSTIRNQKQIIDSIYFDAQGNNFDLYVYTPPVYTYVWDHLLHWYANDKYIYLPEDYGYARSSDAKNDFYLLIEPDELEARIDGWKGHFANRGEMIKNWKAAGGVIVEKWQKL